MHLLFKEENYNVFLIDGKVNMKIFEQLEIIREKNAKRT